MTKEELEKQTMEWKNNYILNLEKRCANYEMEISKMEKGICDICKETEKDKKIEQLEKENAELKSECRRCVHTDCPCILSDYGKDRNGICDHFKDVFDENAELKASLEKQKPS